MQKSDIFIADAHIKSGESYIAKKFIRFLEHIKDSTRTLFILGDLFDFWFGENKASFMLYQPILDKLKELCDAKVKIVYFEGNHEFFMGTFFTDVLGASVYDDAKMIDVDGKSFYIAHGDLINLDDKTYLLWRSIIRSRPLFYFMKFLPPKALLAISKKLSKKSRDSSSEKKEIKDELIEEFITDKKGKGAKAVIFAHTHKPMAENREGFFCVNPGPFSDYGSYAIYENGVFSLKKFI